MRLMILGMALLATLLPYPAAMEAQVTTATLYGTVQDPTGSVVPGGRADLTNDDTGLTYSAPVGAEGDFVFNVLPVGTYTLRVESDGFKTYQSTGITLIASQVVRQTHVLEVGSLTETITVEGRPPLVNTEASEQRESLNSLKVRELPLARRNITQVLKLSSGVDVGGGSLRINGLGKSGTGITVNGTDANSNPSEGRALQQYGGRNYMDVMSIEAVDEVQVMRGIMKAENGGVVSGTINIISKQGTNEIHGSVFENYRSHVFNARNPFQTNIDSSGSLIPKNREVFNQFGGSMGGPVRQNRLFFFATYEGYRETASRRVAGTVPTAALRTTILNALPFQETRLLMDTIPEPTLQLDEFRGRTEAVGTRRRTENHVIARADYRTMPTSNLSFTYTRNRPFGLDPRYNLNGANDREYTYVQDRYNAQFTKSSATWVSETRFGYNYADMERLDNIFTIQDPDSQETIDWQNRIPRMRLRNVGGTITLGSGEVWLMEGATTTLDQKLTFNKGRHTIKFGGRFVHYGGARTNPENPVYEFLNIEEMQANRINSAVISFGSNGPHTSRMYEAGGFVQDDWRASERLTLNLGLRYDFYSNNTVEPTGAIDVTNKNLELPPGADFTNFAFGPRRPRDRPIEHDGWANLGPRLGFAYRLDPQGMTVVRGGVGVMFAAQVPAVLRQSVAGPDIPFRVRYSAIEANRLGVRYPFSNEEVIPIALQDIQATGNELVFSLITPDLQNPYTINYQFNVQRQLTSDLMWEVGYVGTRGVKFPMHRRFNLPDRQTGIRPNPTLIPGGPYFVDMGESVMNHSLQTSARKRFSRNFSFDIHYTWGKTIAYTGGDVGVYYGTDATSGIQDFFNLAIERGNPGFDTTHRAVADLIYELPSFRDSGPLVRGILGGWQVSGIYSGTTGEPVTIRQGCSQGWVCRSDYVGGSMYVPEGVTFGRARVGSHQDVRFLNPDAFARVDEVRGIAQRPGNAGNGLVRGPGQWTLDFSLAKSFSLGEVSRLQVRADMFNALNRVNLGSLNGNVENSDFGTLDAAGAMRQMQMALRITF